MPSLVEALEKKYCIDQQFESLNDDDNGERSGGEGSVKDELISIFIPKVSPLHSVPALLILNDCDIDSAGDFETIKEKCQRVRELDLAQNKLEDWEEIFRILTHMPRIEFLNLSKNCLVSPITKCFVPSIGNLRSMVLNGTYLDWYSIVVLLENLSILEELHLSLNNYKEVLIDSIGSGDGNSENSDAEAGECSVFDKCKTISPHNHLKTLHFTGNPIENWNEICRLGRVFPFLENLVLADCPIKSISCCESINENLPTNADTDECPPHKHFSNLLFLNLSYTNIDAWNNIDLLANFPKLKNLRIKNWPLWDKLECTEHERRQLLIARLPNVSILNGGGTIKASERDDAERAFIRYYMEKPEWERPKRYEELIATYGVLEPLVNVTLKPERRIKVLLTYKNTTEPRLVDIYRSVSDLKQKLENIIGLQANKMRLYYLPKDYKDFGGPEEMKYPNKLLYSYNIQTGDEIIIDEKIKL